MLWLLLFLSADMHFGDATRRGVPFSKDPSVIRFGGRYLLYYSIPPASADAQSAFNDNRGNNGWGVGIAESRNLTDWKRIGEFNASEPYEAKGVAAPFAKVIDGKVHLFYQTYGNGPRDAICHAVSSDGLTFTRNATNPIYRATGDWSSGRAIDVEVVQFRKRWYLYAATRDSESKIQMVTGAVSTDGRFDRASWKPLKTDGPLLRPELPWEQLCIEAPSIVVRGKEMVMFYAGAYNNMPQQIGVARSRDGIHWTRLSNEPFLRNGAPGSWNSSESGHPGAFVDDDGKTYLFYQGNNDNGKTWYLSMLPVDWKGSRPLLLAVPAAIPGKGK